MAIARSTLIQILLDNQKDIENYVIFPRHYDLDSFPLQVFVGVRRSGKSFLLFQKIRQMLQEGHSWKDMLYLDFEDTRLDGFTAVDFNLILECHQEMYGKRPMLFLDEIQNVDGWQKFARNLADKKYSVFITGSNAKMLSKEVMGALGGRYLPVEVYPFSFKEFLDYQQTPSDRLSLTATETKARFMKAYHDYLSWGGLPESINLPVKRTYLSSVFQKIYLGDIAQRNGIANAKLLQLLIKKMAESVMQPISYTRLSKILSSVSGRISVPTVSNYIGFSEDAWLLLRLRNIASAFSEKESICKYYFIDSGLSELIEFLGDCKDIKGLMCEARALIVASPFEGYGFCMPEAQQQGCLVIARNTSGTKEQLDNALQMTGQEIALRYSSVEELAAWLTKVAEEPQEQFRPYTEQAFKVVNQLYTKEANAQQVFEFYNYILNLQQL